MTPDPRTYWRRRHESQGGTAWAAGYVASAHLPYRDVILDAVAALAPTSLLELGCNAGPNLIRLAHRFPDLALTGVDLNPVALDVARSALWRARFEQADLASYLDRQPRQSVDVVLTCYALAYLSPAELPGVIRDCARVARIGLVFAEPMPYDGTLPGYVSPDHGWVHDYRAWIPGASVTPIVPAVDGLNAVLTVRFTPHEGGRPS